MLTYPVALSDCCNESDVTKLTQKGYLDSMIIVSQNTFIFVFLETRKFRFVYDHNFGARIFIYLNSLAVEIPFECSAWHK